MCPGSNIGTNVKYTNTIIVFQVLKDGWLYYGLAISGWIIIYIQAGLIIKETCKPDKISST